MYIERERERCIHNVRQMLRSFFGLMNPKWHRTPSKPPSKANLPPDGPH